MARFAVYHYGALTRGTDSPVLTFDNVPGLPILGYVQAPEGSTIISPVGRTPRLMISSGRGVLTLNAGDAVHTAKRGEHCLSWYPNHTVAEVSA